MPTDKYVQLHPTNAEDNTIDEEVNIYPIIGPNSFSGFKEPGEIFEPQEKLISGTNLKTITIGSTTTNLLEAGNLNLNAALLNLIYPVGAIYISETDPYDGECPIQHNLGGTWERIAEHKFLLIKGPNDTLGNTGGYEDAYVIKHTHPVSEIPNHTHTINSASLTGYFHILNTSGDGDRTVTAAGGILATATFGESTSTSVTYNRETHRPVEVTIDASHSHSMQPAGGIQPTTSNPANAIDSGTGRNMPPYKVVIAWRRTA